MLRTSRLAVAASCLIAWLAIAPAHAADTSGWTRVQTPNFTLVGDASPKELRRLGFELEQFRTAFTLLFPKLRIATPVPTVVIVFDSLKRFEPFMPTLEASAFGWAGSSCPAGRRTTSR